MVFDATLLDEKNGFWCCSSLELVMSVAVVVVVFECFTLLDAETEH